MVCNASNRDKIVHWIRNHAAGLDVELIDETLSTAMLAVQGPKTLDLAITLTGLDFSKLKRYHFGEYGYLGLPITVYRSGYTGEDGLEVVFPSRAAAMLVPLLLGTVEKPHPLIRPAGLGARDTLRIEAAMPLYGHELTEEVDSLSAGQAWCVDLTKDFLGADGMRRIQDDGPRRRLVGLELAGRRIARQGQPVTAEGRTVGVITSGTLSPTLNKSIALAYVESRAAPPGTALEVEIGGRPMACHIVSLPFYRRTGK
jgi:aminomethyltransferase